jgi:hypothetical protein
MANKYHLASIMQWLLSAAICNNGSYRNGNGYQRISNQWLAGYRNVM